MKINGKLNFLYLAMIISLLASCSSDDSNPSPEPEPEPEPVQITKYFIAAENANGTYYLAEDDLTIGTTTTLGNGIEDPNSYTHYAYHGTRAVIGLSYRQGNPAVGVLYGLDENGELTELGAGFQMTNGFSSIGNFENYIVATRGGVTFTDDTQGQNFYFIDLDNDATVSSQQLTTLDLVGNGLETSLVGVADMGDGTFLSGVEVSDGDVDECYVVKLDAGANVVSVLSDERIGRPLGQWRSARYNMIVNNENGDTYVFGNPLGGTKKGGAVRINQGASDFDSSYYFNIQDLADGYIFKKVYHVTGDYFLLEFYNELEATSNTGATQYGIVNVVDQSFSWVAGLPDAENITNVSWPFSADGLVYLALTTGETNPIVYVIEPATASATAGIEIESATGVGGLAKLTYEESSTE